MGRKATIADIRKISPFYAQVYDYIASQEFLDFVAEATGIRDLVHDEQMFGGGTHENLGEAGPRPARGLQLHRRQQAAPAADLLLYLNQEWDVSWGGCLEIHSNPAAAKGESDQGHSAAVQPLRDFRDQ